MRNLTATILLSGLGLAIAGCGSSDEPSSPRPAKSEATSSQAPYGSYVRDLTRQDIRRTAAIRDEAGPNQEAPKPGPLRLVIAKGAGQDVFKIIDDTGFEIGMDFSVSEPGVLNASTYVDPNQGSFCGPAIPAPASYAFEASGDALVLEPARPDPCADRDSMLSGTWKKG